ncbi:MAG: S9 family peptidase [Gemmatimonadota bacterium]|nr:S9 family peptidase [Gemmatimonadota bacterium]
MVPRAFARLTVALAMVGSPLAAHAQQVDYHRADLIRVTAGRVLNNAVVPQWFEDSTRFWYRVNGAAGPVYYLVDPTARAKRPLFDNARLAASMSVAGDTAFDPGNLGFTTIKLINKEQSIEMRVGKRRYECELASYKCQKTDTSKTETPVWAIQSPDKKWEAFNHKFNIWIRPAEGEKRDSVQLTTDGIAEFEYGLQAPQLPPPPENPQRPRPMLIWSPDSKKIAVIRTDERRVRKYPVYSSTGITPRLFQYVFAVPGDSIIPKYDVHVLDVDAKTNVRVQDEPQAHVVHGMSGLQAIKWAKKSDKLYVTNALRGAKRVRLTVVDLKSGQWKKITGDSTSTYLELFAGGGGAPNWDVANDGQDVLWYSERDGWAHLYRYDESGKLKNQITSGPWAVAAIAKVDAPAQQVYYTAWGKEPGVPYYARLYRTSFDGATTTLLTPEEGNHTIRFVPTGKFFVDTYARADVPPITTLRSAVDGHIVMPLEKADAALLYSVGWTPAEVFKVKARDGMTDLWGLMYKPSNFDSTKKYPIITHIYPGPQVGSVGDWGFNTGQSGAARALAELGFIVVEIDHLGTPKRSKAFHDFYYANLGDNGIMDHVVGIKQLAAKHAYIDMDRVGVFGHSGGGFASTDAMFRFPDFFKVAVSEAGNHDNRTYGYWWGEKYQGLFKRDSVTKKDNYEGSANYAMAGNLKGKLLLMHGDMDTNVHPANTLRVVDALIKADKDFDMLIIPDSPHGFPDYAIKKGWDYFVRYLAGGTPPVNYHLLPTPRTTVVAGAPEE